MDRPRLADSERERTRAASTLGVIDLGSNTARLVAFETSAAGTVRAFYEGKDVPRLGSGTGPDGRLADDAVERGVLTLKRFARVVRDLDVPQTLAVATSAVRDAPNGPEFVRRAERASGVLLRILTGAEEAHYAYLGVASAWELGKELIFDLGGGSMQLVDVRDGAERNAVSLPLGVLRLSQRFLAHDPPKHRELEELRAHVRGTLSSVLEAFGGKGYRVNGIGGTVRALARAAIDLRQYPVRRVHGYPLYATEIEALHELLGEMSAEKRRAIPGIGGDRADVVLAGIVVLEELLKETASERIVVSGTGIREGIALEAIGAKLPATAPSLAERSTTAAAESFAFRVDHGREVADAAVALFELLAPRYEWGPSERLALTVAGWMHDAGISIDLWQHATHSAYLIQNYPIWGLDQREVLLASMIAYLHEGDDVPSDWKRAFQPILAAADLAIARQLGAILATAELTAAGRPRFALGSGGRTLTVAFSAATDTAVPPRWQEKIRKPMERMFELEVRARDA
ncbi:MAG TPA: Ppx/GppA phosphatase family protein [Thermoplasmata archaeon]|nr:Ppx/GppA phosphatase family protein [Thermoplasmata archaeon]